jgi:hypothetical protein
MLTRQHFSPKAVAALALTAALVATAARPAFAQDEKQGSPVAAVIKGVLLDPTTYAPAAIAYDATMRDWKTSQPFFQNGFVEHNARFTVSGRPDDWAIGYAAGRSLILRDALNTLEISAAQNLGSRLVERSLMSRYPQHRTLVRTIGWMQRIAVASAMSYHLSADHYRQAQMNAQLTVQLGLK